ncbi:hypothetical protein [Allorhodopirellula solitaria]|uniref:Uncharacterized protein n=1 Tax=Allorhodopirellula solitaria TaxID=2527987 RepID=A0A5C5YIQ2_9BACT|nr:hypothetical protein [Allorhodopirellula solitaria]TWT74740.1 hypothetical protein CA85_00250 [Allorhodopirellula solitaria]
MTHNENILSIVAGVTEQQRLVIVHRSLEQRDAMRVGPVRLHHPDGLLASSPDEPSAEAAPPASRPFCEQIQAIRDRPIVLRQESFSPAVGWFTQSEMELTLDQWAAMRTTLVPHTASSGASVPAPQVRKSRRSAAGRDSNRPRVMSIDGEVIALPLHADQAVPA